jgi:DNA-binding NarL/FixJ family response regulator
MKMNKKAILIVDDNQKFVERIIGLLDDVSSVGNISIAGNYDEACKYLKNDHPDLVLLDINLPGKSGIHLLKDIKSRSGNCRVIMISNHADDYYRTQCKELGADYFLDKSNDFAKVPMIINQLYN